MTACRGRKLRKRWPAELKSQFICTLKKSVSICKVLKCIFWQACGKTGTHTVDDNKISTFWKDKVYAL